MSSFQSFICSSVNKMKKAIVTYNNFLEPNRVENFHIFAHIAYNRLFIAFCLKNNLEYMESKKKVKEFEQLKGLLAKEKIFEGEEISYITKLNETRNKIQHNVLEDEEVIDNIDNFKFLMTLIAIYKRIVFSLDTNINFKENILILNDFKIMNNEKNWYIKDISNFMAKNDVNSLTASIVIPFIPDYTDILKPLDPKIWRKPGEAVKIIKKEIPDFSMNDFINIRKVFLITQNSWEKIDLAKEFSVIKNNENYSQKSLIEKRFYYHIRYVEKIVNICKKMIDYKSFFRQKVKEEMSINIENFEFSNEENK